MLVEHTWIHDACNPEIHDYHTDSMGYMEGLSAPSDITVDHCTIASLGNTNALAFQIATTPYEDIVVNDCYLSGYGYCIDMCNNVTDNTGLRFTNNVAGSDVCWHFGMMYDDFEAQFAEAGNAWYGNTFRVRPGTVRHPGTSPAWVQADNGKFIQPDGGLGFVDFESGG